MNAKQQFITKWSNWWIFNKHKEMLNKAFESELNEVIAVESHRVAELAAPASEGSGEKEVFVQLLDEVRQFHQGQFDLIKIIEKYQPLGLNEVVEKGGVK